MGAVPKILQVSPLVSLLRAELPPHTQTLNHKGLPEIGDDPQLVELKKQLAVQKEDGYFEIWPA